jgi:DNA-binding CsgD family transcriptional regulator/Tfp pilus assembly protein PilF
MTADLVGAGRAALRGGDAAGAREAFEAALTASPGEGEALEGLAAAAYLELDYAAAMELWERAYAAHRAAGDQTGAVRVARKLSYMYGTVLGDWAVMNGWIARAQTLLAGGDESPEAGWVALNLGMFEADRARKEEHFREALAVARRGGDADLEFVTLAYLGASLVHDDRTEEGMVLLDEALAAVAGHDVDDFQVLEEIFCQLFSACEHANDVGRADQWMRVGEEVARRRNLPAVSAFCRTHYGGVLTAAGRWPEADAALMEAVRLWGLGHRMLRAGALIRLADLRVRQGRVEEAEQLLDGLHDDIEAARPLAAIALAKRQPALARHLLDRALTSVEPSSAAAAPLLALLVEVQLAAGDVDDAARTADQLAEGAARQHSDYLVATAALARGLVCAARGDSDPCPGLSEALAAFARARMPMEVARSRLELAAVLAGDRPEVAVAEARAALDGFERLQAARHVDAAAALLRSLGAKTASARSSGDVMTRREAEILDLLGHGLSNPEIADRLYISRKTVEHHVGNILAKLGLRSRAEAAAYAARTGSGQK